MKISGYTIARELGSGGMATVYLARQDRLTRDVALKVMKPIAVAGDDFTSRFVKEGQIIAQLQHPQIVTIYDFDSSDGYHYFSMEYLPGGTLADEIHKGLSVTRAIGITKKIAEALAIAHARGVIHRDVKPQNILFRSDGTPVLTDFGIARAASRGGDSMQLTSYGMVIGSPRYMSPEQSTGQPLDVRSDLYSLGVVFYEMLTNHLPYEADDVVSLAMKHCSDPIPRLPANLARYQPILDRLIAKKPDDRFSTAGQLIRALEMPENGTGTHGVDADATLIVPRKDRPSIQPLPPPPPAKTSGRGARVWMLLVLMALIAVAATYVGMQVIGNRPTLKIAERLPPAEPNRPETAERYETLALEHLAKREFDQGLEILKLGLSITPDDQRLNTLKTLFLDLIAARTHLDKARELQRENLLEEGLRETEAGLRRVPDQPELMALRPELASHIDDIHRRKADSLHDQALANLDAGRTEQAKSQIEEGLGLSPNHPGLRRLAQRIEATEAPEDAVPSIQRAKALLASGAPARSLELITRLLQATPQDPQLLDLRTTANRQLEQQRAKSTEELLRQAEQLKTQGAYPESLTKIGQGLELAPNDARLKTLRDAVLALQDQERQRKANQLLVQARQAFNQDHRDEALRLIREGLAIAPGHAELIELEDRITKNRPSRVAGAASELLADCDKQLTAGPSLEGMSAETLDCYAKVARAHPDDRQVSDRIGDIAASLAEHTRGQLDQFALDAAEQTLGRLHAISPSYPQLAELTENLEKRRALAPDMIRIAGGCFQMGSPASEEGREDDEHLHRVCVEDFDLGRFEVGMKEFERFVQATGYRTDTERRVGGTSGCFTLDQENKTNPWSYQDWANWRKPNKYQPAKDRDPVSCVSWNDAQAYLKWLRKETGGNFRLPTEAEWEYAARAETSTARYWGNEIDARACRFANTADSGHAWADGFPCNDQEDWVAEVGSFEPNPWGLNDMLGNLWEWTCSQYDANYEGSEKVCAPDTSDAPRIMRGGAWNSAPALVRAAYRNRNFPEARYSFVGFRPVLDHTKTEPLRTQGRH